MKIKHLFHSLFTNPVAIFGIIIGISAFSLVAAFIAEAILLMEPCRLCIYQRYPFAIGILIGVMGLLLRKDNGTVSALLGLCSIVFMANSAVATYHTGVERRWWISVVEGCKVSFESNDTQSLLDNIMSAPTGSCEDIPWADPILGLSMANLNVALCFGLALFCAIAAVMIRTSRRA